MLKLEESWIYQRGYQDGLNEGRNDALRPVQDQVIGLIRTRFGEDVQDRVRQIKEPDQLLDLLERVATAGNLAEALLGLPLS